MQRQLTKVEEKRLKQLPRKNSRRRSSVLLERLLNQDQIETAETEKRGSSKHENRRSSDLVIEKKENVKRHKFLLTEEEERTTQYQSVPSLSYRLTTQGERLSMRPTELRVPDEEEKAILAKLQLLRVETERLLKLKDTILRS